MLGKTAIRLMLLASVSFANVSIAAGDTSLLNQGHDAAQAGSQNEAQGMIDRVLRDHPDSAKAHFEEAELLAKEGQLANAASELYAAEHLAPGLPFENRQAVDSLKSRIASLHPGAFSLGAFVIQAGLSKWIPLGVFLVGLGLIAAIVQFFRFMSRRDASRLAAASGPGSSTQAYGAGTTVPPMPPPDADFGKADSSSLDDIRRRRRQLE